MLKSYFLIGLRSLLREKGYSFIKIFGLALGLAASIIIFLYVQEDLSFDKFHRDHQNIARVLTIDMAEGVSSKLVGVSPAAMGPALVDEIPEIVNAVRLNGGGRLDLSYEDELFRCDAGFRTESSFFEIFDFKILEGKKEGVLDEPNSIAITESLAKRIFGDQSPVGKSIRLNQTVDLNIVALVQDPPKNSHIQFDLLRSMTPAQNEEGYAQFLQSWGGISQLTYVQFNGPVNEEIINTKIQEIAQKNNAVEFFKQIIQPLDQVHLHSKSVLFESNFNKSDVQSVYTLSIIAFLILILAIVNFANMVTAKSTSRAKEVGIRKVIGAYKNQLIRQHLAEAILIAFIASIVALLLVYFSLPWLNNNYQRFADFNFMLSTEALLALLGLVVFVGLFSGLYPAFVLSSFNPLMVLKGAFKNSESGTQLRKGLVVFQFTISIALIIGTLIVLQQMDFIFNANLGFDREQVITIAQNQTNIPNTQSLRTELMRNPGIKSVGTSSTRLGQQMGRTGVFPEGISTDENYISSVMSVDENFIPTMGMEIISGRNFATEFSDSTSMLINEEMARLFNWDDPVGKTINLGNPATDATSTPLTVVGLVKDFHFASIKHKVEPIFMVYQPANGAMAIKVSTANLPETISHIEKTWKAINPNTPFEYNFLDDQFANLYRNERAFSAMFTHFAILAIVIACLGLFSLSAFTAEQRRKEISIRKVLGASLFGIWMRLSMEFILLIGIAIIIATGLAWWAMNDWLNDFQYRITLDFYPFALAAIGSVVIALLTISYQTIKATLINPAEILKGE
jgi:putative ABC transport system permease protein